MIAIDATFVALAVERLIGYPDAVYRAIGHPVEWVGRAIGILEGAMNRPERPKNQGRLAGAAALAILLAAGLAVTVPLHLLFAKTPGGFLAEALLALPFLAQRSLHDHVQTVATALGRSLAEARMAVSMIVGRDPATLDEAGVSRAALESLAENASDGVVAPALWFLAGGLPGIVAYKIVNTADSMIGHKSERYLHFGWASARLDDLLNLPASRLTAMLFASAAVFMLRASPENAVKAVRRDARNHVSPNAGWPESALAGALGIRLGGPRTYQGRLVDLASMGDGRTDLDRHDIRRGLKLYSRMLTLFAGLVLVLALVT